MDQRVEVFLADVLALEGETPHAVRQAVRARACSARAELGRIPRAFWIGDFYRH